MTDTIIADVSEFQQVIDWAAYGASVPGVIVRAHNGSRPDLYWARNLAGARANVMWRGFYQYLPASIDPVAAARAFQATTGPLLPGEVAILDLEEGSGDQRGRRQAWLDTLQDPIEWTYSGLAFARSHLPGVRIDWIAAYGQGEPVDAHTMWQFTNARVFPGIAKPCDASVFHGTILPGLTGGFGRGVGSSTGATLTSTGTPVPPALAQEDDDMPTIISSPTHGLAVLDGGRLLPVGDQATVDAGSAAGLKRWAITDADFLRWMTHSTGTWLLFNSAAGWAVWSSGSATGIGDQATVDQLKSNGVPIITLSPADFARFTAAASTSTAQPTDPTALAAALTSVHATITFTTGA